LHFSFGPVQGFVSQSRRTRDLWSSSFLLSHLAATAIEAVRKYGLQHGGTIVRPSWAAESFQRTQELDYGSVPNQFAADFTAASCDEAIEQAKVTARLANDAILAEWQKVADEVWSEYLAAIAGIGDDTRQIWERQVAAFWEVSWVIGSVEKSSTLLAARKNWRTTPATVEPGDHCTMMSDRQELSGWIRSQSCKTREEQDKFWMAFREQKDDRGRSKLSKLDLAEDERLCAIALIKRLFPKIPEQAIARKLDHTNWPSTAYVAAIPWFVSVAECGKSQAAALNYAEDVKELAENSLGERQSKIPKLVALKNEGHTGEFQSLDGNFFQRAAIDNPRVTPLEKLRDGESDDQARRRLQKSLAELCQIAGEKPSAFYALFLMDGDSMGALLNAARLLDPTNGESRASQALGRFAGAVPKTVGEHLGVTIYAGGDDVLAMLPVKCALKCAAALAKSYKDAFKAEFKGPSSESLTAGATLSGAIVYAHYHTPLRDVLKTAHHLLDDVAKDATGRDSLAIAVFKSSGITAQWAAPWEHIRKVRDDAKADNIIDALVCDLTRRDGSDTSEATTDRSAEFSSGFLYNVRERFAALTDKALTKPGEFGKLSPELIEKDNDLLKSVLVADYMRGRQHQTDDGSDSRRKSETERHQERRDHAEKAIERLMRLSQRVTRVRIDGSDPQTFELKPEPDTLGIDGALLVRFLASDGKEDAE